MISRIRFGRPAPSVASTVLAVLLAVSPASAGRDSPEAHLPSALAGVTVASACPAPAPGHASCLAQVVLERGTRKHLTSTTPLGYGPADLKSAYHLPVSRGQGQTIAVVAAFDHPDAEADLRHYRSTYGLPPCTSRNGCFTKIDQRGGTDYPVPDTGWALEISLDLDMVSAACPNCDILLVEADDNSFENLAYAVDQAAARGATAISNSYGAYVDIGDAERLPDGTRIGDHYHHPGIAVTASSGDAGYGLAYPASSRYTVAVGGTSLSRASNERGWAETAWRYAGSGCSTRNAKPAWQAGIRCPKRAMADVSAVADPETGVAVYHSYGVVPRGWYIVGGTSASSPIIAAVYGLAGNVSSVDYPAALPYRYPDRLHDVKRGGNGFCTARYLCIAGAGYDGPTGLGTPRGIGAFRARSQGDRP